MDFSHWHNKNFGKNYKGSSKRPSAPPPEEEKKPDSIQRQINNKLDEITKLKRQIKTTKNNESLLAELEMVKGEINKITNEGTQIKGIFDNAYYVNDVFEDKRCNS